MHGCELVISGCGEIRVWQWIFAWLFFLEIDRSWCGEIGAGWMPWKEGNINRSSKNMQRDLSVDVGLMLVSV
jgi:hypothetical protein